MVLKAAEESGYVNIKLTIEYDGSGNILAGKDKKTNLQYNKLSKNLYRFYYREGNLS